MDATEKACSKLRHRLHLAFTGINLEDNDTPHQVPTPLHEDCMKILELHSANSRPFSKSVYFQSVFDPLQSRLPAEIITRIGLDEVIDEWLESVNSCVEDAITDMAITHIEYEVQTMHAAVSDQYRRSRVEEEAIKNAIIDEFNDFIKSVLSKAVFGILAVCTVGSAMAMTANPLVATPVAPVIAGVAAAIVAYVAVLELTYNPKDVNTNVTESLCSVLAKKETIDSLVDQFKNILQHGKTNSGQDAREAPAVMERSGAICIDDNAARRKTMKTKYPDIKMESNVENAANVVQENPLCSYQIISCPNLLPAVVKAFTVEGLNSTLCLKTNVTAIHLFCDDSYRLFPSVAYRHYQRLNLGKYPAAVLSTVSFDYPALDKSLNCEPPLACFLSVEEWFERIEYLQGRPIYSKFFNVAKELEISHCVKEFITVRLECPFRPLNGQIAEIKAREIELCERFTQELVNGMETKGKCEAIVRLYTEAGPLFFFSYLNRELRRGFKSKRLLKFAKLACRLMRAMNGCIYHARLEDKVDITVLFGPHANDRSTRLYRTISVSDEALEEYRKAAECKGLIFFREFTSTSVSKRQAIEFATNYFDNKKPFLMFEINFIEAIPTEIDADTAYPLDISRISTHEEEKEVLIPPLTLYQVDTFASVPDGEYPAHYVLHLSMQPHYNKIPTAELLAILL